MKKIKRMGIGLICGLMLVSLTSCKIGKLSISMDDSSGVGIGISSEEKSTEVQGEEKESVKTTGTKSDKSEKFKFDTTIEETLIADEDGIKITARELKFENNTPKLSIYIENNTDKDLSFYSGTMASSMNAVNGYMVNSMYLNCDVTAGKNASDEISLEKDELESYGIHEIEEIQLSIYVVDSDYNDVLSVGPVQIQTSAYANLSTETDSLKAVAGSGEFYNLSNTDLLFSSEEEIYNEDDMKITAAYYIQESGGDYYLFLEVENQSSDVRDIFFKDIAVNNIELTSGRWTSSTVLPGHRALIDMNLTNMNEASWESLGISEAGVITLYVGQEDANGNEISEVRAVNVEISDAGTEISGTEVYNDNDIVVTAKAYEEDDTYYILPLLVQNNSDAEVYFDPEYDSYSVNGSMIDAWCDSTEVKAGKASVVNLEIVKSDAEDAGITSIGDITETSFQVTLEDNETFNDIDEPTITVTK